MAWKWVYGKKMIFYYEKNYLSATVQYAADLL